MKVPASETLGGPQVPKSSVPMSVEREQALLEEARLLQEVAKNVPVAIAY